MNPLSRPKGWDRGYGGGGPFFSPKEGLILKPNYQ